MIILRVLLGGVFILASVDKIRYPRIFAESLLAYQVVPESLVTLVALVIPWLELLTGVSLVAGYRYRGSAVVAGLLSLTFVAILGSVVWKGLDITCGCFIGVEWMKVDWRHIVFNLAMAVVALVVYLRGPGVWALESRSCRE